MSVVLLLLRFSVIITSSIPFLQNFNSLQINDKNRRPKKQLKPNNRSRSLKQSTIMYRYEPVRNSHRASPHNVRTVTSTTPDLSIQELRQQKGQSRQPIRPRVELPEYHHYRSYCRIVNAGRKEPQIPVERIDNRIPGWQTYYECLPVSTLVYGYLHDVGRTTATPGSRFIRPGN